MFLASSLMGIRWFIAIIADFPDIFRSHVEMMVMIDISLLSLIPSFLWILMAYNRSF